MTKPPAKKISPSATRLTGPSSPQAILALNRQKRIIKLRSQGKTYQEIADVIGMHPRNVIASMARALAKLNADAMETASTYREDQWAKCEIMVEAVLPAAANGDLDSIDTVLKLFARMARLRGLDIQPESTGTDASPWTILTPDQRREQILARLEEIKRIKEGSQALQVAQGETETEVIEIVDAEFENENGRENGRKPTNEKEPPNGTPH